MDIDTLIMIIVVGVIILTNILKQYKKFKEEQGQGTDTPEPKWKQVLLKTPEPPPEPPVDKKGLDKIASPDEKSYRRIASPGTKNKYNRRENDKPAEVSRHPYRIFSIQELRKAVVWSEILGKPVGLKNFHP